MEAVADINVVEKSCGLTQVINRCGFKMEEGEVYGRLGDNSAEKTTWMKMILGLRKKYGFGDYCRFNILRSGK